MAVFTHDSLGTPAGRWHEAPERDTVAALDLDGVERLVVVAAHPDDESLGASGLIVACAERGVPVTLVLATLGERSHPASPTHTPADLATRRGHEAETALAILAPQADLVLAGLHDGAVADGADQLTTRLVDLVGPEAEHVLLVAPWRRDGHPDHEAAGRAAAAAARRTDARLVEYPVWWWHWSTPEQTPWTLLRRLDLDEESRRRRRAAIAAHTSQVEPLSAEPGDEVLLAPEVLAHFDGAMELYVTEPAYDDRLDRLHGELSDPWGTDERWYEARKRDLVLAMLPALPLGRVLDIGCSTGALTERLAARADHVTALDASPTAVSAAARRLASDVAAGRVSVQVADVADGLPQSLAEETFDTIVLSEVGYFLSPRALKRLVDALCDRLAPDGSILACHWRHPIEGWPLDGPDVHRVVAARCPHPRQAEYADRDVQVVVHAPDTAWPEATR